MRKLNFIFTAFLSFTMILCFSGVTVSAFDKNISLIPEYEIDMQYLIYRDEDAGTVSAEFGKKDGSLTLFNTGGSFPRASYVVDASLDASKKIVLDYYFIVESGLGQISVSYNDTEWKIGEIIREDKREGIDIKSGIYKGKVILSDLYIANNFIENDIFCLSNINFYCVGNESKMIVKKLRIYEEGEENNIPTLNPDLINQTPNIIEPTQQIINTYNPVGDIKDNGSEMDSTVYYIAAISAAVVGGVIAIFIIASRKRNRK